MSSPSSLPRAYLIGRPAVCCGVVLPVCPCVVSFCKVHEHDTHDLLQTSSRGCHEDATRKTASLNLSFNEASRGKTIYPADMGVRPGRYYIDSAASWRMVLERRWQRQRCGFVNYGAVLEL